MFLSLGRKYKQKSRNFQANKEKKHNQLFLNDHYDFANTSLG